jgi:hypothetical protein
MRISHGNAILHSVTEDVGYFSGLIRKAKNDFRNLGSLDVIDLKKKERDIRKGDNGLWYLKCERAQACSLASCEN